MNERIIEYARALDEVSRARRRDFHKYAETAWYEMRTSAIIAKTLTELGYEVLTGSQVCLDEARIGQRRTEGPRGAGSSPGSSGGVSDGGNETGFYRRYRYFTVRRGAGGGFAV